MASRLSNAAYDHLIGQLRENAYRQFTKTITESELPEGESAL